MVWDVYVVNALIRLFFRPLRYVTTCHVSLYEDFGSKKRALCRHMSLILYCVCPSYVKGCCNM